MFTAIFFYLFSAILITSALGVILLRNTVYSALSLIVAFLNAAILMLLMRSEFLTFVIMIVYVGAVAVLFLFVVMMLDLKAPALKKTFGKHLPALLSVGALLLVEVCLICFYYQASSKAPDLLAFPRPRGVENVAALGQIIYTNFILNFQIAGYVLLVAMIGAIVLTMDDKKKRDFKRQSASQQLHRDPKSTLVLTSPEIGKGISKQAYLFQQSTTHSEVNS